MKNSQPAGQSSSGTIISALNQFRDPSQADRWNKEHDQPHASADVTGTIASQEPACTGNRKHDNGGDTPTVKLAARAPGAHQYEQRRNHRDEEKDMIQVQGDRGLRFDV